MANDSPVERFAFHEARDALDNAPVVLIHGPRQAGKSTLAQAIAAAEGTRRLITLDDPIPRSLAQTDPVAFLSEFPPPLLIDEAQRAPELFLAMKADVDRKRHPGRYLLTGSANVLTLPKLSDSLAGRMAIIELLPFCQAEIAGSKGHFVDWAFSGKPAPAATPSREDDLVERLMRGGFPEPSRKAAASARHRWFGDYTKTLIERDVRDLANIDALTQLPRVLSLLASRAGSTLNVVSLSRDTGIPNTTLHRYIDLLRAVFLVQLVPAWSNNRGSTFTKAPKAFLVDTGLLCYLDNVTPTTLKTNRGRLGPLLENFVAMELLKLSGASETKPTVMHLRTVRQLEVDFVLEARGGDVVGVEVKASGSLNPTDASGLRFMRELAGERFRRGILLYLGDEVQPLDRGIVAVPISHLWQL